MIGRVLLWQTVRPPHPNRQLWIVLAYVRTVNTIARGRQGNGCHVSISPADIRFLDGQNPHGAACGKRWGTTSVPLRPPRPMLTPSTPAPWSLLTLPCHHRPPRAGSNGVPPRIGPHDVQPRRNVPSGTAASVGPGSTSASTGMDSWVADQRIRALAKVRKARVTSTVTLCPT